MSGSVTAVFAVIGCLVVTALMLVNIVTGGSDLRTGIVPLAAGVLAASAALAVLTARSRRIGVPRRWASVASVATALALFGIGGFFFSLAGLSASGSDLLDDDGAVVTTVGTLVASTLTLLMMPLSLLMWGLAVFRDHRIPPLMRIEPWLWVVVLFIGGAVVSALPEDRELWPQLIWVTAMAGLVVHFSLGARKATPARSPSAAHVAQL